MQIGPNKITLSMNRVMAGVPPAVEGGRPAARKSRFGQTMHCLDYEGLLRRARCPARRQSGGPPLRSLRGLWSACTISIAISAAVVLGGCSVGPNFKRPESPPGAGFSPKPLRDPTASLSAVAGDAQRFVSGQDIPFDWWKAFQCPELDRLVDKALRANPTIDSAKAALRQAQELVSAQRGYYFPAVGVDYNVERQQLAGNLGGNSPGIQGNGSTIQTYQNPGGPAPFNGPVTYTFHTAQLSVGYTLDVFGHNRRQVESLAAQAAVQGFELDAAYITLASSVVGAAIQEASTRAQIEATEKIIDANTQSLEALRNQRKEGYVSDLDVAAVEAALAQVQATLPPLQKQLEQTRDLIRALVGNLPNQDVEETFRLSSLHLPEDLPLSLPSTIIKQRPDVRAAEEQMRSANAQIGVAIANRLPQFTLSAAYGGAASQITQIFETGGPFWNLIGDFSQSLFDGFTLLHMQRAAKQGFIQAAAQYRSTVIGAFQNVADTLHALEFDGDTLKAAVRAERTAKHSLDLITNQFQVGYVNYLALLNAEETYEQALINLTQAQANRYADTAALFQALGGGWWNGGAELSKN
jgi:NodT family efflux transporter outer membrane factor (OMF) lipoprotein